MIGSTVAVATTILEIRLGIEGLHLRRHGELQQADGVILVRRVLRPPAPETFTCVSATSKVGSSTLMARPTSSGPVRPHPSASGPHSRNFRSPDRKRRPECRARLHGRRRGLAREVGLDAPQPLLGLSAP